MEPNGLNVKPNMTEPTTSIKKKSRKGLIISLICSGVALIGIIITMILLLMLGGLSKQDYLNAYKITRSISQHVNNNESIISSLDTSASREDVEKAIAEIREFKAKLDSNIRELGKEIAIRKDTRANKKYDALVVAYEEYRNNVDLLIEVYEQSLPVFMDIANIGNKFTDIADENQISDLITELRQLASNASDINTDNDTINGAMSDMSDAMDMMADALEKALADDGINFMDDVSSASEDLQSAAESFTDELEELSDIGEDLADIINDLGEYLTSKANGGSVQAGM